MMLDDLRQIAREAGRLIMGYYRSGSEAGVQYKADTSPLTLADQASHSEIEKAFRSPTPEIPVVSQESNPADRTDLAATDRSWLADPLDGTKEFIKQTDQFTVNIALIQDKTPVLGVVYAPAIDLFYYADRQQGAWRQQQNSTAQPIHVRPADRSQLCVVASKDHAGPEVASMLNRIPGAQLTSMGSSLKFCLVAEGKADLYPRLTPTMEWDTAAAQCVVESAGGSVVDRDGNPLRYQKPELRNPGLLAVGDPNIPWRDYLL
jgi:3'(2'), 5'-bisphosphate nucleotidase